MLPYPCLIMKFLSANCITIPRNEPLLKLRKALDSVTLNQSKSHKGQKKPPSSTSHGFMSTDLTHMSEALKLLTKRSNNFATVQSSLLVTQEYLKLNLMKVMSDVATICKHLNVVET